MEYGWNFTIFCLKMMVTSGPEKIFLKFLSEYWKRLEKHFRKRLFPRFPKNDEIYKKNPLVFFNILKELLLVQKQTIHQQKALDVSYLEPEGQRRGSIMGCHSHLAQKAFFVNFYGRVEGFWLFGFYLVNNF